jgi:kynurenine formamidase
MIEKLSRPSYDELHVLEGTSLRTAWGQYGETDELGAVNLLTAERVRAAAHSVVTGERFPLGLPLHMPDPPIYGRKPFQHKVYATMPNITDDRLDSFFPQGSSQWDALAHFAHPTKGFYNGFTMADVLDRGKVGIHNPAMKGIVGRGVLADVARYLNGRGTPLTPDHRVEIDAQTVLDTLAAQGVELQPGDILCVRTGWMAYYKALDQQGREQLAESIRALSFASPGLAPASDYARLIWNNGVVALAVDNTGVEPAPAPMTTQPTPTYDFDNLLHVQVMAMLGVHLGELFDFEALADACAADGRYDFLLASAPLWVKGGVGSPPNAIAIR